MSARVRVAALGGVGLVQVDAAHGQPQVPVQVPHPLAVALRQVRVDGHQVRPAAGQGVQVQRQRGDQRLALARGHLGHLPLVQRDAADELHVVVHHVPGQGLPRHLHLGAHQPVGGGLDGGERLGKDLVQHPFQLAPSSRRSAAPICCDSASRSAASSRDAAAGAQLRQLGLGLGGGLADGGAELLRLRPSARRRTRPSGARTRG